MGTNLTLIPLPPDADLKRTPIYAMAVLELCRSSHLFSSILQLSEDHGTVWTGGGGEILLPDSESWPDPDEPKEKLIQVQYLLHFAKHQQVEDSMQNQAAWAYLKCLDPDTYIALSWS